MASDGGQDDKRGHSGQALEAAVHNTHTEAEPMRRGEAKAGEGTPRTKDAFLERRHGREIDTCPLGDRVGAAKHGQRCPSRRARALARYVALAEDRRGLMMEDDESITVGDDDMPVDPNAADYNDDDEGADVDGEPITSVNGSERLIWKDES